MVKWSRELIIKNIYYLTGKKGIQLKELEEKAGEKAGGVDPDVRDHRSAPGEDLDRLVDQRGQDAERRNIEQIAPARQGTVIRAPQQV